MISLAARWSLLVFSTINLNLASLLIPLGKAKGLGYFLSTEARGEVYNNSYLYDCDTVPQLSQAIKGHLLGLTTNLSQYGSIKNSFGNSCMYDKSPSVVGLG